VRRISYLLAVVPAMVLTASASAGTTGGIYDMRAMLNEAHPFDPSSVRPLPLLEPAAGPASSPAAAPLPPGAAPPPPIMRNPAAPARPVTAEEDRLRREGPVRVSAADTQKGGRPARGGYYLSFGTGLSTSDELRGLTSAGQNFATDMDDGYAVTAAFGRYVGNDVRFDVELATHAFDYDETTVGNNQRSGGSFVMTTLMLNGYYDVHFDWPVTPFFGAGVGAAFLDGTTKFVGGQTVPGRDDTEVAFQGVIGATYSLTYRWRLGFDARYIGTGDDDVNVILLGLNARYDM